MSYQGVSAPIKLGVGGLLTDLAPRDIPVTNLIHAMNVDIRDGVISKEAGARRWNRNAFSTSVKALTSWMPVDGRNYFYVVTGDGKVWKQLDRETRTEITANSTSEPTTLTLGEFVHVVAGGEESPTDPKKLFIFSGNNPIQVISGNASVRTNLQTPAADWATSEYPRFGVSHRNRLFVFGQHRAYASDPDDHENFTSAAAKQFPIYPGKNERLYGAYVYRGKLFVFKKPFGLYTLVDTDTNPTNWYFTELSNEFGIAGPFAVTEAFGDLLAGNSSRSITSLAASDKLGDVESGNIFNMLKVEQELLRMVSVSGIEQQQAIYHEKSKMALFTLRQSGYVANNGLIKIDFSRQRPELTLSNKDQVNCFALARDQDNEKIFYGSNDGYIYEYGTEPREILRVFRPTAPVAALTGAGAGNVDNGTYRWGVTFFDDTHETGLSGPSDPITVVDKTVNGQVTLTDVPIDVTGSATKRRIYRRDMSANTDLWKLVGEIANNTSTTFTDNVANSSLTNNQPPTRNSFNTSYSAVFWIPHTDFSWLDPQLSSVDKNFDALEIEFISTGQFTTYVDYFIDGVFMETLSFKPYVGPTLDDFVLDSDRLPGRVSRSVRKRIKGYGRSFSAKCYNDGLCESFQLTEFRVQFRPSNQKQKAPSSGR